jgi:hypothetical protein
MRSVWIVSLIAGCGFTGPDSPVGDDQGGPGGGSGGSGSGSSAGTAGCDVQVGSLKLCLTFDGHDVHDVLVPPHRLAIGLGVAPILRILTSNSDAVRLDGNTRIRFDESPDFDVQNLTVDMWIDPDESMQSGSYTIVDNHLQYTVSFEQDHHVQCSIGDQSVNSNNPISSGWHHVACRYEAGRRDLRIYVDGNAAGCGQGPGSIPTNGDGGVAIGASYDGTSYQNNFIGSLDALHLYGSVLSEDAICSDAGRQNCVKGCPGDGGGDGGGAHPHH